MPTLAYLCTICYRECIWLFFQAMYTALHTCSTSLLYHGAFTPPATHSKTYSSSLTSSIPTLEYEGRAVSVSGTLLSRAFSAQSWELFSRVTIRNQLSLPPNRKYQARREIPHKETWALSLAWKGSNSPIRCNMLLTPPYSMLKMA